MSTRHTANGGLSAADIDGIRSRLAAGRKPKVVFTEAAGQIAGEAGQVVQLTDPTTSDEWVVVRFGKDELPFSPTDLSVPRRGRPATGPTPANGTAPEKATAPAKAAPAKAAPAKASAAPRSTAPSVPAPRTSSASATAATTEPAAGAKPETGPSPEPAPARPAKRARRSVRSAKPKVPSTMTVTLAYDSGEWTVAAHQGSKTLAKPYVVRAADALKMVAMLDVPGVHDAVEAIVSAELTEAAQRAEKLRSELADVEARLAELRDVS
jgi:hypothetical protein